MKLLTAELRAQLPPLYSQEKNQDPTVHVLCSAQHKTCYVSATVMFCSFDSPRLNLPGKL